MEEKEHQNDTALLEALEAHGNLEPGELAVMLGREPAEVEAALDRLRSENVIVGQRVLINWEKAGRDRVVALIAVNLTPERDVGFDKVAQRIARFPQVRSVHLMSGTYDLSVVVEGNSLQEVASFVAAKLAPIDQVTQTTTHFILKTYKEDGLLLEEADEDPRLGVTP